MKRALITGGCGFIGSNLAKKLVELGWLVDIVDDMSGGSLDSLKDLSFKVLPSSNFISFYYQSLNRKEGQPNSSPVIHQERSQNTVLVIQDDFSSEHLLQHIKNKSYDVVFHQAAIPRVLYSVENPAETTFVNVFSTIRLFEACAKNVSKVVWASSSSVYGGAEILPTSEEERGKVLPKSPYAWQKFTIEDYAKMAYELYELDIVCLRYFNVYGPGQLGNSAYATAIAAWCNAIKNNLSLRSDGDGEQTRDMCYIDNVVHANVLAANSDLTFKGKAYNVACGERVSNNQILDYFKSKFDLKVENAPERVGDVKHTLADISLIKNELGYEPLVKFWEGLEKTITWWDLG